MAKKSPPRKTKKTEARGGSAAKAAPIKDADFPIVGIGASAGGLEALEAFFKAMPSDAGMAFVLVVHLAPSHSSILPELLQRHTKMPVCPVKDGAKIEPGQSVVLKVVGLRGEAFGGRIARVSTHVDPRTRTLKARAVVTNSEGLLRANMFGAALITIHDKRPVLVVPKGAVQWEGCCNVVFVKRSDTLYEPRKVRLGYETDRFYEVKSGVEPGETVVTQGSFLLKTEILKGSIGAGCCPEVTPRE